MNGEQLDYALRQAFDDISEAARDFQDTCEWLSKLADSTFTFADNQRFVRWHASLKTQWDYMRAKMDEIEKLQNTEADNSR